MPIGIWNLEWLTHNSQRAYPIAADATLEDATSTFKIPDDFIVSLYLPVHWGLDVSPGKFFIRAIASYETGFSVTVGYDSDSGPVDVASALISVATFSENAQYTLGGTGDFADSVGYLVIGSLAGISKQPNGQFLFDLAGSRLEPDVIRPSIRGVTSLQTDNGGELSQPLHGVIRLQAGRNFRITPVIAAGADPVLIFDAISGAGLTESCVCDDEATDPIRTINGIPPDAAGNFVLLGNDCLQIQSGDHQLTLKDVCSEPCCGCKELRTLTEAMESFGSKATTLENFLVSLEARVQQMDQVVLGSKLGDRGCTQATPCS